jgi:hypothetical protein
MIDMSVTVSLPNSEKKEVPLTVFTTKEFLEAVRQTASSNYEWATKCYEKQLEKLPEKQLIARFMQTGERARDMYERLFENDDSPLYSLIHYAYYGNPKQEEVDFYVNEYRQFMMLSAEANALVDLLMKCKGEYVIKKGPNLSKANEICKTLKRRLDETALFWGSA